MSGGAQGFRVEPDDLVAHASHLDGLVDRLNTAAQAADYAMSDDAYGLLCAFLPPIINPTGEKAKEAISGAIEGVQATADNVRTAAKSYQEGDEGQSKPFKKVATEGMLSKTDSGEVKERFRVGGVQAPTGQNVPFTRDAMPAEARYESAEPLQPKERVDVAPDET
nr:type VII secretion target [Amycolatopsis nivea]